MVVRLSRLIWRRVPSARPVSVAAVGRGAGVGANRGRVEAAAKDEIHHALIGAIAIFQRDFLGQDVDPLDRFGRNVAKLAEAGDAQAVEQQHRPPRAATARASDLWGDGFEQFVDAGRPGGADVAAVELILGRNVADDGGALALADDDDRLVFVTRQPTDRHRSSARSLARPPAPVRARSAEHAPGRSAAVASKIKRITLSCVAFAGRFLNDELEMATSTTSAFRPTVATRGSGEQLESGDGGDDDQDQRAAGSSVAGSSKKAMPTITVPTAPIPPHTA